VPVLTGSFFDDSELERVKQAIDIAELIGGYVSLKRKGGDLWGRCPFHNEKSASFHVRPDRGMYHCFGCGKGGNAINFVMEIERLSFAEAVRMLAEKAGITLTRKQTRENNPVEGREREQLFFACSVAEKWFHERLTNAPQSKESTAAYDYLGQRGITPDIIKRFRLGFAEPGWDGLVTYANRAGVSGEILVKAGLAYRKKSGDGFVDRFRGRIIFPIVSLAGKPVAFGARRLEGVTPGEDDAKYVNSSETEIYRKGEHLFGLVTARDEIRRAGIAYLVEGYIDLLAVVQAGVLNVVASLGTSLTEEQAKLLARFTGKVITLYDGDTAGRNAAVRASDILTIAGVEARVVMLPASEDPDSLLRKEGSRALLDAMAKEMSFVQFRLDLIGLDRQQGQKELLEASKGIMETLRAVRDPFQRDLLMGELANLSGLRREILDKAIGGKKTESLPVVVADKLVVPSDQNPEKALLQALIGHPSLIPEAMEYVAAEQFEHPGLRAIYLALEQEYLAGNKPSPDALMDKISDPLLRSFLAESRLVSEKYTPENAREELIECTNLLAKRSIKRELSEIEMALRQSGLTVEENRSRLERLVELNRQLRTLKV